MKLGKLITKGLLASQKFYKSEMSVPKQLIVYTNNEHKAPIN